MFIQKSMSSYSVSSFSPPNFIARCLNQLFILAIALLFAYTESFYSSVMFFMIIGFNILNFKIKFEKDPFLKYVITNQIDYRPVSINREKIIFLVLFLLSVCFLCFKVIVLLIPFFNNELSKKSVNFLETIPKYCRRISSFIWEADEYSRADLVAQTIFCLVCFGFYWMNRNLKIYYDYYTVQIYKKIFTNYFKYITLTLVVLLLLLKEVVLFDWNFFGFTENLIIVFMLIGLFFRFKVGNYKNLKQYLTIAKYITILRLTLCVSAMSFGHLFAETFDYDAIKFLIADTQTPVYQGITKLSMLITLYYLYNVASFCIKFQRLFIFKDKSPFFGTLQSKPYKLFFINYFAKNLLSILKVIDIKNTVKHNLDLRFKFYEHLRKYTYFRKSFEYSFKSNNANYGVSRKYSVYELWNKYWNIVDIYKFDVLMIILNTGMVILLGNKAYQTNILSIFYLGLALIIILFNNFKATWYASLVFAVGPSLLIILIYAFIKIEITMNISYFSLDMLEMMKAFGFEFNYQILTQLIHGQFVMLVTTLAYIIVLMYIKNKGHLKQRYDILENLKHRRMMIIDADEDVLFLFTSICRFLLIIAKYALILMVCSDVLSYASYINFCILFFVFLNLVFDSNYLFDCLAGIMLSTFLLKFISRFDILYGIFESHKGFLFGLYFNSGSFDNIDSPLRFSMNQESIFISNYLVLYAIFTVKALLMKTQTSKFMENKTFKTKYLSEIYNTFVDLVKQSRNVIDSTKIFFVYFIIFHFCANMDSDMMFTAIEFSLMSALLIYHMILFKRYGNVDSIVFYCLFLIYFLFISFKFTNEYIKCFEFYTANVPSTEHHELDRNRKQFYENFYKLYPFAVRVCLSLIALSSIRKQTVSTSKKEHEPLENKEIAHQSDVRDKFYYQVLKVISVFLKEILLFYTSIRILTQPNIFKIAYLCCYMHYFISQIRSLSKIFDKFRFVQIIESKIHFYKYSILDPNFKTRFKKEGVDINDPIFEDFNIAYYRLMTKTIFRKIHKRVYTTWIWTFVVVIVYLGALFFVKLDNMASLSDMAFKLIFNITKNNVEVKEEFYDVMIVLAVTVFEIYFIDILKSRPVKNEKEIIRNISSLILLRYKNTFVGYGDKDSKILIRISESLKLGDFATLLKETKHLGLQEEDFKFQKLKSSPSNVDDVNFVANLNHSMSPLEKYILLTHNRSKLCFLQVFRGFMAFLQRFIVIPLLIGVMYTGRSSFSITSIAILYFFYSKKEYFKLLNNMNFWVAVVCLVGYILSYISSTAIITIDLGSAVNSIADFLHKDTLNGLPYLFLYTTLIKGFYMGMIILCLYSIVLIDKVDQEIFKYIKNRTIAGCKYVIIDYKYWGRDRYFSFYQIKKAVLTTLPDVFFMVSLISYYHIGGFVAYVSLIFLMAYKLIFTFYMQKPFSHSASTQYSNYYKLFTYLNFAVMLCYIFPLSLDILSITIQNRVIFSSMIILNFAILDVASDYECQVEKKIAEDYYFFRSQLSILGLVFARNEKNILDIVNMEVKNQYLKAHYHRNDYSPLKKNLVRGPHDFAQETLETISIFAKNKSYKQYIFDQLSMVTALALRFKLWLRKKLLETNSTSTNLFSLFSNYLYKNQPFVYEQYDLDLLKLHRGDHSELEKLIKIIEDNKIHLFKKYQRNFVTEIRTRIKETEELADTYNRNRNVTIGQSSPLLAGGSKININGANIFLIKELTVDRLAEQIKTTPDNNFGENFFKYKIENDEYLVLRNFDQISVELNDLQMADIGAKEYFKWVLFLFWVRFEVISNFILICMLCFGQGIISSIYIFMLLFLILIEDRVKNVRYWKLFYLVFMANLIIQLFINTRYSLAKFDGSSRPNGSIVPSEKLVSIAIFLYGKIDQNYLLIIFILIELMLIHISDSFGKERTIEEIESGSQALLRVSFHKNSWQYVFNRQNNINISEINIIEKKLKEKFKMILNEKEYTIFLVNLIKRKTAFYKICKEKFAVFIYHLSKILPNYKQDHELIKSRFFKDYLWRNFGYPLRKSGVNYHAYQYITLIVMLAFFFVFYFNMQGKNKSMLDIIKNNEIHGTLSINISIILLAICFERYIFSKTVIYWIDCTDSERDIAYRHLRIMNFDSNQPRIRALTMKECFRKAVRKLLMVMKWKTPNTIDPVNAYKHNPLVTKFYFSVAIWVYITILSIIWLPLVSNNHISEGFFPRIFCNTIYKTQDHPNEPEYQCNSFSTNIYLQIFFLLGNLHLVVAIAQIKGGFNNFYYYKNENYNKTKAALSFYIYKYTPYIRELKTIIDYAASRTALNLFQWFKLEDIATVIMTAQNNEIAAKNQSGGSFSKLTKRFIGFLFLFFFFMLLVAPLYLFSDILPNNIIDEVKSAQISVTVDVSSGAYLFYKNTGYTIEKLNAYNTWVQKAKQDDRLRKVSDELFQKLSFYSASQTFLDFTKETAENIVDEYRRKKMLKISVKMMLNTSYRGELTTAFSFELDSENAHNFLRTISSSKCSQISKNKTILGKGKKLLDLKEIFQNAEQLTDYADLGFENTYFLTVYCNPESNKFSFDLSDGESNKIDFLVLSENINNSVDLLQQYTSSNVSIMSIYAIIFSYIGLTLIRKAFFDQAHLMWTTEMPNAQKLQEHIYMISFARQQGDLYMEEIFYNKLIDLFRAPEKIKKLTGPLYNPKMHPQRNQKAFK